MKVMRTLWNGDTEGKECIMERITCEIKALSGQFSVLNFGIVHRVCIQSYMLSLE